jgi:hypothetical protein
MRTYAVDVRLIAPIIALMTAILACSLFEPVPTPTQPIPPPPTTAEAQPTSNPFIGTWLSTDSDGSNQQMVIAQNPNNSFSMDYIDYGASACGKDANNQPLFSATANGVLTGTGGTLSGTVGVFCQRNPAGFLTDANFVLYYDSGSGTMKDNQGIVWTKQ